MVTIENKRVARTGVASLGWRLVRGYVQETLTVKSDRWCVIEDGKILAECRNKTAAEKIFNSLEWAGRVA